MGGGEGAGKMYEILQEIGREKLKVQLIVIAGRNKGLETRLKRNLSKFHFPMRVYGFTDQVHELMSESDLIITKAGPGTIAEALAMGLPIIITSWLPGQEEGNVEFVVRENVGRVSKDPKRVVEIIKEFQEASEFEALKKNIKRVSRPQAAIEIAHEIFNYL
jgi:1,2-diacylglycerol 3-beta-galactosyltransferase